MTEEHKQEAITANRLFNWFMNWFPGDSDICIGDRYKGLGEDADRFLIMHHKAMIAEENEPSDDVSPLWDCADFNCPGKNPEGSNFCNVCGTRLKPITDIMANVKAVSQVLIPAAMQDAVSRAWGIIANVSDSDWGKQSKEWQKAAREWSKDFERLASSFGESEDK